MAKKKTELKPIYRVDLDDDGDYFFNEEGEILASWSSNDANYRSEYMDPLFKALGFKMTWVKRTDPRFEAKLRERLMDNYGNEDLVNEIMEAGG